MIICQQLGKTYPGQLPTLKKVDLCLPKQGFYLLLGESGSGKTTFLNILAGMLPFEEGSIAWQGECYGSQLPEMLGGEAEYITQEPFFADFLSASENLQLLGASDERVRETLTRFGLEDKSTQMPATLSGGERQRLALARALLKGRRILLLDEPTAALDMANKTRIFELLKELSREFLILCATHDPDARAYAEAVVEFGKDSRVILRERSEPKDPIKDCDAMGFFDSAPCRSVAQNDTLSAPCRSIAQNDTLSAPCRSIAQNDTLSTPFLKKWFRSGRREHFSRFCFIFFLTLALCLICLADTPAHKSAVTMARMYHLNMLKLTLHGELAPGEVLPEDPRLKYLLLDYTGSCPDGIVYTPDQLMYDLPDYELVLNVLPEEASLCRISGRLRYGSWFSGPDQIILPPAMAEKLAGKQTEKLIGSTITKKLYQRGEVTLTIVGITEELSEADRLYLYAAGADINYGEWVSREGDENLFFLSASTLDIYQEDESFHTSSRDWQQIYHLYFDNYGDMAAYFREYGEALMGEYGDNLRLEQGGLPPSYELRWPLISGILLPAAALVTMLTGLFYGVLRRTEFMYNSRFVAVFEYAGFEKNKLLRQLTGLSLLELAKQLLIALILAAAITITGNLINRSRFLLPLEMFSYNPWLINGFCLLLFGMAALALHLAFRRFRSESWYALQMAARDLL